METIARLGARSGVVLAAALLLAAAPLVPGMPVYWITLLDNIGLATLVALGLVLLTGVGGMTSFGQAAFCGFGAYATAILTTRYGVSPWATLPVALLVTLAASALLGFLTVRLSGHYLPLGTIAWGMAIYFLFGRLDALGRHDGVTGIPPLSVFGYELTDSRAMFYVIWAFVLAALLATSRLLDSRMGRAIRALRGAVGAAEACGVDTARVKLIVFVYAALLASISGWLYAHMQRTVNPAPFGVNASIEYLFMAVVGGAGHVGAAVLGSTLVVLLKELLQRVMPALLGHMANYETIVFGVLLVALLQKARGGLWPLVERVLPAPPPPRVAEDAPPPPGREPPPRGAPVLSLDRVRKQFGGLVAVDDVSLNVRAGEIVGLIGPNGAGKSTTFNLVAGALGLTSGAVTFLGEPVAGLPPRAMAARGLGRTFQHVKVLPEMSVLDNIALGAHGRGSAGVLAACLRLDRAEETRLLAEAARQARRVGLGDHLHRPAG
ncbi:MAG TPA: ATP-binding cassette domain-containing protein, partial [Beijerinckiaceae bacterium]